MDTNEHEFEDIDPELLSRLQQEGDETQVEADGNDEEEEQHAGRPPSRAKKRIKQEIERRKALEAQLAQERQMREQYEAELAEQRKRVEEYENQQAEGMKSRAEELKAQRAAALEEGDLELATKLGDEYHLLQYEMRDREREKPQQKAEPQRRQGEDDESPGITKAAQRWMNRNQSWLNGDSEESRARVSRAIEIEKELLRMGYTTDDDELYIEIDRRLEAPEPARRGSPGLDRDGGGENVRRNKRITESDKRLMRMSNLNPNNPKHRDAWLKRNDPLEPGY